MHSMVLLHAKHPWFGRTGDSIPVNSDVYLYPLRHICTALLPVIYPSLAPPILLYPIIALLAEWQFIGIHSQLVLWSREEHIFRHPFRSHISNATCGHCSDVLGVFSKFNEVAAVLGSVYW